MIWAEATPGAASAQEPEHPNTVAHVALGASQVLGIYLVGSLYLDRDVLRWPGQQYVGPGSGLNYAFELGGPTDRLGESSDLPLHEKVLVRFASDREVAAVLSSREMREVLCASIRPPRAPWAVAKRHLDLGRPCSPATVKGSPLSDRKLRRGDDYRVDMCLRAHGNLFGLVREPPAIGR